MQRCYRDGICRPVWGSLVLLLLAAPALVADTVETLQGESLETTIHGIRDGRLLATGAADDLPLDGVTVIERAKPPAGVGGPHLLLDLQGGGRLWAKSAVYDDETFTLTGIGEKPLELAIDAIRCVRFRPQFSTPAFETALAKPSAEVDRVFVEFAEQEFQSLEGLLEKITSDSVIFQWQGESRTLPRAKVAALVAAQVLDRQQPAAVVRLANGSLLPGELMSLEEGQLEMQVLGAGELTLPWEAVQRIDLHSDRLKYLSDFETYSEKRAAIVTFSRPAARDRSIGGNPLRLGEKTFAKGFGVHAVSELTFELAGEYDLLLATVGIDHETEGKGDCRCRILLDGEELWSQRVKGADPPQELRLKISGGKLLTLEVAAGEDLDLADHVDWAAARVLKLSN